MGISKIPYPVVSLPLIVMLALTSCAPFEIPLEEEVTPALSVPPVPTPTVARGNLVAFFLGQDGAGYAGQACQHGDAPDNIHIRLSNIRADVAVVAYRVEDHLGGIWVWPCNSFNWMVVPLASAPGQVDLYMKPWRDAPAGTLYTVAVQYGDGKWESTVVAGLRVYRTVLFLTPASERKGGLEAVFLGQDGASYAGEGCRKGTAPDNIHIRLSSMRTDVAVTAYRVEDHTGGVWVWPCNSFNWSLVPITSVPGQVDLYLKPWGDTPAGTLYTVTVQYSDGTGEQVTVIGSRVRP